VEQIDLLRRVIEVLEAQNITYMIVGSIASGAHGEPRFTRDIDIVVALPPRQVGPLCDAFPPDEYYVSRDAALEAVRRRGQFNVIHPASGNKIDFMLARNDPWSRTQLSRRWKMHVLTDREAAVAAPEDVIISKMASYREGGSEKHLRDITGILKVSGDDVDRAYVAHWADELGLTTIWRAILRRLGEPVSE